MLAADDRVIMISGANRGIGKAVADRLLEGGYRLSLGARDPATLEAAFGPEDERRLHARYDAEDRATDTAWVEATLARFGRLDGLVNNAGASSSFSIEEGDEAELDRLWTINCKGPLFLTRAALPHLRKSGVGRVVNVASMSGKRVRNENVAYNMTKHAVIALSHGTRRIGWDDGVRCTTVCPSFVRTDMTANSTKVTPDQMIQPEDFAELVATALALPNTAAMAEMLVNCRLEDLF